MVDVAEAWSRFYRPLSSVYLSVWLYGHIALSTEALPAVPFELGLALLSLPVLFLLSMVVLNRDNVKETVRNLGSEIRGAVGG